MLSDAVFRSWRMRSWLRLLLSKHVKAWSKRCMNFRLSLRLCPRPNRRSVTGVLCLCVFLMQS